MDSDEEDDEETVENDSDSDSSDPWKNLRTDLDVRDALNPSYVEEVKRFLDKGESRVVAKTKALNFLHTYIHTYILVFWVECVS